MNVTRNEIIEQLSASRVVETVAERLSASRLARYDLGDLAQEVYLILLQYNEKRLCEMYNARQLNYFIVGIIRRQCAIKYSAFGKIIDFNRITCDLEEAGLHEK